MKTKIELIYKLCPMTLVVDYKQHITPCTFNQFLQEGRVSIITAARFKGKIWITIPFFHKLKFPKNLYYLNSIINNIFTGVEGILTKE